MTMSKERPTGRTIAGFCIFSVRYSQDGREILAGASDRRLYVYDREEKRLMLKIEAHEDDINAVCFGDAASNIVYSGGDDGLCKVWDRRTLSEGNPSPVGVLAGHLDGITFIDSKGDGRYLITNSKDQSIKLWDIRRFSGDPGLEATKEAVSMQHWDYRWQSVPKRGAISRRSSQPARDMFIAAALEVDFWWDGTTAVWHYDERRKRNINPETEIGSKLLGDEDSSDEDGRKITYNLRSRKRASCGITSAAREQARQSESGQSQSTSGRGLVVIGGRSARTGRRTRMRELVLAGVSPDSDSESGDDSRGATVADRGHIYKIA